MTEEVAELKNLSLNQPLRLSAGPSTKRDWTLTEEVIRIRQTDEGNNKEALLLALCSRTFTSQAVIFSGKKFQARRLKVLFGLVGLKAAELHGSLTRAQRLEALELFRKQEVDFLIATDIAARGLDIIGVQTVINFKCPRNLTGYLSRTGRARNAVTFVTDKDLHLQSAISKRNGSYLKRTFAERPMKKWSEIIEQLEAQVGSILQKESEEKALMTAEMESIKLSGSNV